MELGAVVNSGGLHTGGNIAARSWRISKLFLQAKKWTKRLVHRTENVITGTVGTKCVFEKHGEWG